MTTTIKITALTDIGANLTGTTLVPVVNMAGTPTTERANVNNIANYVLNKATGANLGPVANVKITGGTAGQVLTTNGSNVLSWTTVSSGNSTYGNSNVAAYLPTYTGNISGNVIIANLFSGNGSSLSAIAGANVSGTVDNANLAQLIDVSDVNNNFSYHVVLSAGSGDKSIHIDADDNLQYNPADGTLTAVRVDATYVLANLQYSTGYPLANVTGAGNIATINLTGSNSNVLYGNGVFAAIAGGANTGNVTFDDVTVQGVNGLNLSAGADFTANLAYLQVRAGDFASHIHFDTGNNQAYDLIVGDDQKFVQVSSTGNILMSSYDGTNSYQWNMDTTGNLNLPLNGNINANGGGITQTINENLDIVVQDEDDDGWSLRNTITDSTGNNLSQTTLDRDSFTIETDMLGAAYRWQFDGNTLQVSNDSTIRGFASNVVVQSMVSGGGGTTSIQSVSSINDPNIFSTFDATTTGANISVYDGGSNSGVGYTWQFDNNGRLTFPGTPRIDTSTNNFEVQAAEAINFEANSVVNIYTDTGNTTYQWQFGDDGNLTLPGNLVYIGASPAPSISGFSSVSAEEFTNDTSNVTINANSNTWNFDSTGNLTIPSTSGGFIKTASNASIGIVAMDNGTNNPAQLLSMNVGNGNATSILSAYATNVTIQTNAAGTIRTWAFDSAGNLTLPANTFTINYANGTQVSLGGGSNIANGNSNVTIATSAGNVVTNVNGSTVFTAYSGGIKVGGSGVLQSPGGAAAITLNNNGANIPTANITNTLNVTGAGGANITGNLTAGNISTGGTLTSTGKFGYASGSTVTQTTNRGNGVTINTIAGTIITTSAAMVANEIDTFSVINSSVDPNNDIVLAQIVSPNQGTYNCIAGPALIGGFSNGFYINIVNISGFTTSDETITIRYMVIKAPNA